MENNFKNLQTLNFQNTIVTSFICNGNNRKDRTCDKYIELGKIFLMAKTPKVIFMDEQIYDIFSEYANEYNFFIKINQNDLYLNEFTNKITNFDVNTTFKDKDTLTYLYIMCNKTDFIKRAIILNIFNTPNYIWIDFGIKHIFNCESSEFIKNIEGLNNKKYDKVRIASIWDLNKRYNYDIYKDIHWYFAGGVFGGDKDKLIEFADKTKEMCLQVIEEKKTLMWEVNIWYLVYLKNPELFISYKADHNASIIVNY